MIARMTTIQLSPERLEDGVRFFHEQLLPTLQGPVGFQGGYALVNRQSGTLVAITLWETAAALQASEAVLNRLRAQGVQTLAATQPPTTEVYEVAVQA